ncbi:MAG: energy-coupling factor transporter ATPase [Thermoleophilia bacterium]
MAGSILNSSAGCGDAPALSFRGVSFSYPGAGSAAVADIDFDVYPGELVALVGGNGSGKSTLARLSNGLLLPETGTVTVGGMSTSDSDRIWELRTQVGLLFQSPEDQIVGATVADDAAFGLENLGVPPAEMSRRVELVLRQLELWPERDTEPHLLSGGQRQRLALAGVLVLEPAVLVLDEPTSLLDPVGRREVMRLVEEVRQKGVGVLAITQHMDEALPAERLYVLEGGRLVYSGSPPDFFRRGLQQSLPLLPPSALRLWEAVVPAELRRDRVPPVDEEELIPALAAVLEEKAREEGSAGP